jgi:hypothetical protein
MEKIIYQLTIDDVQNVALKELNRALTTEEISQLIDSISEKIPWYDSIADSISELNIE